MDVRVVGFGAHAEVCGEECGGEEVGDVVLGGAGNSGFVVWFDRHGISGVGVDCADNIDPGVGASELVFGGFDVWVVEVDVFAGGNSENGCVGQNGCGAKTKSGQVDSLEVDDCADFSCALLGSQQA